MKRDWMIPLLAVTIVALAGCGGKQDADAVQEAAVQTEAATEESSAAQAEETKDEQISIEFHRDEETLYEETDGAELVNIEWQLPEFKGNFKGLAAVNERLQTEKEQTLEHIRNGEASDASGLSLYEGAKEDYTWRKEETPKGEEVSFPGYYYGKSYGIERADKNIISLTDLTETYMGGAHGSHIKAGLNFDPDTGAEVLLADIAVDEAAFRGFVLEELTAQADKRQQKEQVFFGGYEEYISDLINDGLWYLSQDGLVFISQEYMMQPYAAGTIEFTIPYETLEGYLKEEYFLPENAEFTVTGQENTAADEPEAEEQTAEETAQTPQEQQVQAAAEGLLSELLTWTGLQYAYGQDTQEIFLTPENMVEMAGYGFAHTEGAYETYYNDEVTGLVVPKEKIEEQMAACFGQGAAGEAIEAAVQSDGGVYKDDDGSYVIQLGDWGLMAPDFMIGSMEQNEDGSWTVWTDYMMYDYEQGKQGETRAEGIYTLQESPEGSHGYIITEMKLEIF